MSEIKGGPIMNKPISVVCRIIDMLEKPDLKTVEIRGLEWDFDYDYIKWDSKNFYEAYDIIHMPNVGPLIDDVIACYYNTDITNKTITFTYENETIIFDENQMGH